MSEQPRTAAGRAVKHEQDCYECAVSDSGWCPVHSPGYAPDMDFDEVTENIEAGWGHREHITDDSPCWCNPMIVKP